MKYFYHYASQIKERNFIESQRDENGVLIEKEHALDAYIVAFYADTVLGDVSMNSLSKQAI